MLFTSTNNIIEKNTLGTLLNNEVGKNYIIPVNVSDNGMQIMTSITLSKDEIKGGSSTLMKLRVDQALWKRNRVDEDTCVLAF